MKVIITCECTPDEARAFMGLPDVTKLNDALTNQLKDQMTSMSPDKLMKMWAPMMDMSQFTNFWTQGSSSSKK